MLVQDLSTTVLYVLALAKLEAPPEAKAALGKAHLLEHHWKQWEEQENKHKEHSNRNLLVLMPPQYKNTLDAKKEDCFLLRFFPHI